MFRHKSVLKYGWKTYEQDVEYADKNAYVTKRSIRSRRKWKRREKGMKATRKQGTKKKEKKERKKEREREREREGGRKGEREKGRQAANTVYYNAWVRCHTYADPPKIASAWALMFSKSIPGRAREIVKQIKRRALASDHSASRFSSTM